MRGGILLLAPAALLAACSSESESVPAVAEAADGAETIFCAVGGKKELAKVCAVERTQAEGTLFLTVRHPDGGFRRFEVLKDGRGLEPADGAEPAKIRISGETLEVAIGQDRYSFPATRADNAAEH